MKKSKRILSAIVAVVMVVCMFAMSFTVSAKDQGNNFGDLVESLIKHGVIIDDIHSMTDEEVEAMLDQLYWVYEDDPIGSVEMIVNCVKMYENWKDTQRHLAAGEDPVLYGKLERYYVKWLHDHCAGVDYTPDEKPTLPSDVTVPPLPTLPQKPTAPNPDPTKPDPTKPEPTKPEPVKPDPTKAPEKTTEAPAVPDAPAEKPPVKDVDTGDATVISAVAVLGLAGASLLVLSKKRKEN